MSPPTVGNWRSGDSLTIVRSAALWLAKRIWPDHNEQYSRARHLDVTTAQVAGLDDIAELLARLIEDPKAAVMRGELIDPTPTRRVRRLLASRRTNSLTMPCRSCHISRRPACCARIARCAAGGLQLLAQADGQRLHVRPQCRDLPPHRY
jgi:hypothetical protein